MTKRKFLKAVKRVKNLPRGVNLLKYGFNKIKNTLLTNQKSLTVAYPSSIMIELTNHCNIKCITCAREYAFGEKMDKGFMNFEKFKQIIDEVYPYVDSIGLTGLGETFLYKHFAEAVDYIREKSKGIIISCSINAHLKNSVEVAISVINKIDTIQISIDGIGDVYNTVRRKADFNFFIENVKQIAAASKNSSTDLMFNMVVLKENYHQMTDMLNLANELGIRFLNIIPMNIVSRTDLDISYYKFFQTEEFKKEYFKTKEMAKTIKNVELTFYDFESPASFKKCRFMWNYFYITWDGFVPPCCAKPFPKEKNFGSVFSDKLINVLNTSDFQNFRKDWLAERTPEFCDKCFNIYLESIHSESKNS
ncbi:MAG: SPASM domain-containing protein [Ignavibacteriaceae bacterium]|nr:SPASM domain-containing protein [Ignavibacteriaceae bacterium]